MYDCQKKRDYFPRLPTYVLSTKKPKPGCPVNQAMLVSVFFSCLVKR